MSAVLSNERLSPEFMLLTVAHPNQARMGQFYMLRAWDRIPVLSRPISVYDADADRLVFLYRTVGEGTQRLAALKPGDELTLDGPLGNGFPAPAGNVALVGGGAGIAPLYLAARTLRRLDGNRKVDIYLGFTRQTVLTGAFAAVSTGFHLDVGGYITDLIDPLSYDAILACGPEPMMRALWKKCQDCGCSAPVYVSLEARMACGIGACLVCTRPVAGGRKRVCKDGPVFLASEVFIDA